MARKYHVVLEREDGKWSVQFGDYDRATVVAERRDMLEGYAPVKRRASDLLVVTVASARQSFINAAVAALNTPVQT